MSESNEAEGMRELEREVERKYGAELLAAIKQVWSEKAIPKSLTKKRQAERKHFLSRKESSPQVSSVKRFEEASESDLLGFLYKLVLYAPEDWYEVVLERPLPEGAKNDFGSIGVAFDASSRLRRSGVDHYHWGLTAKLRGGRGEDEGDDAEFFYIGDGRKELLRKQDLPQQRPSGRIRVVAVSDTHLFHSGLKLPPRGEVLVHAGDLCYEESRSTQAKILEEYKASGGPLSGPDFVRWFKASGLELHEALSWLGSRLGFEHKVLVGGNHDYVLEQLGLESAVEICKAYGVTYLYTERAPVRLKFRSGTSATFWGTGLSFVAQMSATRAVASGNNSFQLALDEGDAFIDKVGLSKGSVDIMIAHSPPQGVMLNKASTGPNPLARLIETVKPKLYVCGHSHRPADPLKGVWEDMDGTLGINAACLGVWNQLHGYPVVVDMDLGPPRQPVPERCAKCIIQ